MSRLPRITAVELLRALRRDGWELVRQTGSHHILGHSTKPGLVSVPFHRTRTLPLGTLKNIIDQAGLTVEELRDLL